MTLPVDHDHAGRGGLDRQPEMLLARSLSAERLFPGFERTHLDVRIPESRAHKSDRERGDHQRQPEFRAVQSRVFASKPQPAKRERNSEDPGQQPAQ